MDKTLPEQARVVDETLAGWLDSTIESVRGDSGDVLAED
jgi:hypothetical protein